VNGSHPLAAGLLLCMVNGIDVVSGQPFVRDTYVVDDATRYGNSLKMDRTTNGFLTLAAPDTGWLGPISVLWVGRIDALADYLCIIQKGSGGGGGGAGPLDTYITGSGDVSFNRGSNSPTNINGMVTTLGDHQLLYTHDLTTVSLYVDANQAGTGSFTDAPAGVNGAIRIGRRDDGATQMAGAVAICAVWSRCLTAGDRATLYTDPFCMLEDY
jgi:hypothetical protein